MILNDHPNRSLLFVLGALLAAAALFGCGQSEPGGPSTTLSITRDFGSATVGQQRNVPATNGLTAMRQLQKSAKVDATYGGRFVNSIDGLTGGDGRDWLFYVDGVESEIAANDRRLSGGEIVQWDFHAWQDVKTGGAIVGAFPQPLKTRGVKLSCVPPSGVPCDTVSGALRAEQIQTDAAGAKSVAVHVGTWSEIKGEEGVPDLTELAADNGAFASFSRDGKRITIVDDRGVEAQTLENSTGLIAAHRDGDRITWLVTGVDDQGVLNAASSLNTAALTNRFALAVTPQGPLSLPRPSRADDQTEPDAAQ
ncbi:MAG: DUF4430 domain-containing protein [Solirubrobacterales bacterium]